MKMEWLRNISVAITLVSFTTNRSKELQLDSYDDLSWSYIDDNKYVYNKLVAD